jgi:hypothetical protein
MRIHITDKISRPMLFSSRFACYGAEDDRTGQTGQRGWTGLSQAGPAVGLHLKTTEFFSKQSDDKRKQTVC